LITAAGHPAYPPKGPIHGVPIAPITMVLRLRYSSWFVSPVGEPARLAPFGKYDAVGQYLSVLTILPNELLERFCRMWCSAIDRAVTAASFFTMTLRFASRSFPPSAFLSFVADFE
jgi:hypothetical protein